MVDKKAGPAKEDAEQKDTASSTTPKSALLRAESASRRAVPALQGAAPAASDEPVKIEPENNDRAAALRILVRHLQHTREATSTIIELAELAGLAREKLHDFLSNNIKRDKAAVYEQIATKLAKQLRPLRKENSTLAHAVSQVYGESANWDSVGGNGKPIVGLSAARAKRSIKEDEAMHHAALPLLYGLSALVRMSNEFVQDPKSPGTHYQGYSLSILNVIPPYFQKGEHTLFKLRQRGRAVGATVDIEGAVLMQNDRILLAGADVGQDRPIFASAFLNLQDLALYRAVDAGRTTNDPAKVISGVMTGVSNTRAHFGALFDLVYIPGSFVAEKDVADQVRAEQFKEVYRKARDATGVSNRDTLMKKLDDLGIKVPEQIFVDLLERSHNSPVLSVN